MSIDLILKKIPHRPPFLFLDSIIEVTDEGAIAERVILETEPQFQGHYPGNPIMPGVLLCEAVFQLGAYYLVTRLEKEGKTLEGKTPVLTRIKEAKFKNIVRPNDSIQIQVQMQEVLGGFFFLKGNIKKENKMMMSVEFGLGYV